MTIGEETVNGQVWRTLKSTAMKQGIVWSYSQGYLVVSTDTGLGMKAIQTQDQRLPVGALGGLYGANAVGGERESPQDSPGSIRKAPWRLSWRRFPNPALQKLGADRDPVLVVLDASTEQLQLASRTRITSLVLDLMMTGSAAANVKRITL